ncbi:MAG TPA: C-type lectin domain-containing protein [Polyangiaceae bacterium]
MILSRRAGPGSVVSALFLATACLTPESTDFYEAPSAILGEGGAAGTSSDAGTTSGATAGTGASGGNAGSAAANAGTSGSGAVAATGGDGGSSASTGSGATGGSTSEGGAAGEGAGETGGEPSDGGTGGTTPVSCETYGPKAADFDGHCYLFVKNEVTWHDAASDCESRGAHLVTLSSENRTRAEFLAENAFVWELGEATPLWIAAIDGKGALEPGDGTYYRWTTEEPMTFDNWSASQPNNSAAACQDNRPCSCDDATCYEHCGFQWATEGKEGSVPGWNDRLCEHFIAYVCEWDAP